MAVTAHYMAESLVDGRLELCNRLVAFRAVPYSHTGENLADEFLNIIDELGLSNMVRRELVFQNSKLTLCVICESQ